MSCPSSDLPGNGAAAKTLGVNATTKINILTSPRRTYFTESTRCFSAFHFSSLWEETMLPFFIRYSPADQF